MKRMRIAPVFWFVLFLPSLVFADASYEDPPPQEEDVPIPIFHENFEGGFPPPGWTVYYYGVARDHEAGGCDLSSAQNRNGSILTAMMAAIGLFAFFLSVRRRETR